MTKKERTRKSEPAKSSRKAEKTTEQASRKGTTQDELLVTRETRSTRKEIRTQTPRRSGTG